MEQVPLVYAFPQLLVMTSVAAADGMNCLNDAQASGRPDSPSHLFSALSSELRQQGMCAHVT